MFGSDFRESFRVVLLVAPGEHHRIHHCGKSVKVLEQGSRPLGLTQEKYVFAAFLTGFEQFISCLCGERLEVLH